MHPDGLGLMLRYVVMDVLHRAIKNVAHLPLPPGPLVK